MVGGSGVGDADNDGSNGIVQGDSDEDDDDATGIGMYISFTDSVFGVLFAKSRALPENDGFALRTVKAFKRNGEIHFRKFVLNCEGKLSIFVKTFQFFSFFFFSFSSSFLLKFSFQCVCCRLQTNFEATNKRMCGCEVRSSYRALVEWQYLNDGPTCELEWVRFGVWFVSHRMTFNLFEC